MQVTLSFGPGNLLTRSVEYGTTVGEVVSDPNVKAVLGYGDNVETRVAGNVVPGDYVVTDGDTVQLVTVAHRKN